MTTTAAPTAEFARLRLERLRALQRENLELNEREWRERRTVLSSTPRNIFVQINAVCNADCNFCSKGYDYPLFRLDDYLAKYGEQMTPVLRRAEQVILTGSGEFLGLPDAENILKYFNREFPHVQKYIATNASHLTPKVCELIAGSGSRYTLQLSLHASDPETHKQMMRFNGWKKVIENIKYLGELRRTNGGNPSLFFMFVMTTLNIEKLPEFVRFAKEMGADRCMAGYFNIYESQQKYLSLYFKQELANKYIEEARRVGQEVGISVQLPPMFGMTPTAYDKPSCCHEPWYQMMFNVDGRILPCDIYGNFNETLAEKSFADIWNGPHYRAIRKALRDNTGCLQTCGRHNPVGVNDWRSHVIHRHKDPKQIVKEYQEALRKP